MNVTCKDDMLAANPPLRSEQTPCGDIKIARKRKGRGEKVLVGRISRKPNKDQDADSEHCEGNLFEIRKKAGVVGPGSKPNKQVNEQRPILTRELLDLAPRRKRMDRGKSEVNKVAVVDDLGDDMMKRGKERMLRIANCGTVGTRKFRDNTTSIDQWTETTSPRVKLKLKSLPDCSFVDRGIIKRSTPTLERSAISGYEDLNSEWHNSNPSATQARGDKENCCGSVAGKNLEKEMSRELQGIKNSFVKVDQWQMEFEDVNTEGGRGV